MNGKEITKCSTIWKIKGSCDRFWPSQASQLPVCLERLGAIVTVNDGKPFEEKSSSTKVYWKKGIKVVTGRPPSELLDEELCGHGQKSGILIRIDGRKALEKEYSSPTEVNLAYLISDAPIIGITGSNGKTTTTTMIGKS